MDIIDKSTYYMKVMQAYVVNTESSDDPEGEKFKRVQVYIPEMQEEIDYKAYMGKSGSKKGDNDFRKFPWAYNTVSDINNGNLVYVANVSNDINSFVIIARDITSSGGGTGGGESLDATGVAELLIPFIIHEEWNPHIENSGLRASSHLLDYPYVPQSEHRVLLDCIGWDSNVPICNYACYTTDTSPYWSIGLLNWDHSRAYNLIFSIAQQDSNWLNNFDISVRGYDLCTKLKEDVEKGSPSSKNYNLGKTSNNKLIKGVQNMLTSSTGKHAQNNLAREDVTGYVQNLIDNYGIGNPAVLIYVGDIINQYGSVPTETGKIIKNLSSLASTYESNISSELSSYENPSQMMKEVEALHYWWSQVGHSYAPKENNNANGYYQRRKRCIAYVRELYKQGKLSQFGGGLTVIGNLYSCTYNGVSLAFPFETTEIVDSTSTSSQGTFKVKCPKGFTITSLFGKRASGNHTGVDFSAPEGVVLYASHDGTLTIKDTGGNGYGYHAILTFTQGEDTWKVYYGHMIKGSSKQYGFEEGGTYQVKTGTAIGQLDSTGNSSGNHLHYELRRNGNYINPMPYMGLADKSIHGSISGLSNFLEE